MVIQTRYMNKSKTIGETENVKVLWRDNYGETDTIRDRDTERQRTSYRETER